MSKCSITIPFSSHLGLALWLHNHYSWPVHYHKLAEQITICTSSPTFKEFYASEIEKLPDDFTKNLLLGSIRVLDDEANPVRLHLFAVGLRELFHDLLKLQAPDEEVLSSSWCDAAAAQNITKNHRAQFATQGGISDTTLFELGIPVDHLSELRQTVVRTINDTNDLLHFKVREIASDTGMIESTASEFLDVLFNFLQTIEDCKQDISHKIETHIFGILEDSFPDKIHENQDREVTQYLVPLWGEVEDENCEVTEISSKEISIRFTADVEIDLETSGMSGFHSQNGMFPVVLEYKASVDDISTLKLVSSEIAEDAPIWLEGEDQRWERDNSAEITRLVNKDPDI